MVLVPSLTALGLGFGGSELILSLLKRSSASAASRDRQSLRLLWIVIMLSVLASMVLKIAAPAVAIPYAQRLYPAGFAVFALGTLLRWYSIFFLGRFFTVNVAISADHRVIDTGPYRHVRHPSYAGSLLQFFGYGLCLGNLLSLIALLLPVFWAYRRRMGIEEAALADALGEPYRAYMKRTRRLVPAIY